MEHQEIWDILAARIHQESLTETEEKLFQDWLKENRGVYAQLETFYREHVGLSTGEIDRYWRENTIRRCKQSGKRRLFRYAAFAAMVMLVIGTGLYLLFSLETPCPQIAEVAIFPGSPKASLTLASGEKFDLLQTDTVICEESGRIRNKHNRLEYFSAKTSLPTVAPEYNTLNIPRGGEYQLKLADGTLVWLNSETTLRYPVLFSQSERRVYLEGEAYFQVAKDAEHPFIVSVDGVDITALGTQFNILASGKNKPVYTTLVEGLVRVKQEKGKVCVLHPSEQAVCLKETGVIQVRQVKTSVYTSWKDGYYTFEQQTVENIMNTLARWYDIQVFYQNQEVAQLRFSGRLKRYEDITNLLTMIKLTNDVNFEIKGKTIVIKNGINRK